MVAKPWPSQGQFGRGRANPDNTHRWTYKRDSWRPRKPARAHCGEPWSRGYVKNLLLPNLGKEQTNYNSSWPRKSQPKGSLHCQMGLLIKLGSMVFLMQMRANKSIREMRTTNMNRSVDFVGAG